MTPDPPPTGPDDLDLDPDDDAVLAVLDDTATPEQRRRVARDPDLRARLAEQRAARDALADPVLALPEATADRLRATALAALDGEADGDDAERDDLDAEEDVDPRPVAPLIPRRPRRRLPPWPAVAAAVILLISLGLTLIVSDRSGEDTATERNAISLDDAAAEDAARDLGAEAESGATTTGNESTRADEDAAGAPTAGFDALPRFPDEAALRRDLQAIDPTTLQPPGAATTGTLDAGPAGEAAALCDQGLRAVEPAMGPVQAALLVLVDDQEVLVMSNPVAATAAEPASIRLTVFEPRSCTPLFAVQR